MKRILTACSLVLAMLAVPGFSQDPNATGSLPDMAYEVQTMTGKITRSDPNRQKVTIKTQENREITLKVPSSVDLNQYKKGDKVTAEFVEAVGVQMRKATDQESRAPLQVVDSATVSRSGVEQIQQVMALVQVTRVDRNRGYVEFRDVNGDRQSIRVNDPTLMDQLKNGDKLVISYTEATASTLRKIE